MLSIRSSGETKPNPLFAENKRKAGEDNTAWVARNLPKAAFPCLVLLGGNNPVHFRLRVAQSHARDDLTPSSWSHVALLDPINSKNAKATLATTPLSEISLEPVGGFGYPPVNNGVQSGSLKNYADPNKWPNIAIIHLPLKAADIAKTLAKFTKQRPALDTLELVLSWLAFVWGVGRAGNPLVDGKGIPSAVVVEYVLGALQYELTPGLDSRSSCPEAIWQSARWWHNYYEKSCGKVLKGAWSVSHWLVDEQK